MRRLATNFVLGWCRVFDGIVAIGSLGLFFGSLTNIVADKLGYEDGEDSYDSYYREW